MLKIITALPPELEQRLLPEIFAAGHVVLARAAEAGEVLTKLESEAVDLLLLHPRLLRLSPAVLAEIRRRGVSFAMLTANVDEEQLAEELGCTQIFSASSTWEELQSQISFTPESSQSQLSAVWNPSSENPGAEQNASTSHDVFAEPEWMQAETVLLANIPELSRAAIPGALQGEAPVAHDGSRAISERDSSRIGYEAFPRLIAVWGPQGAPGRTTVALNLAHELSTQGKGVLLIDADSYGASMGARLGLVEEASTLAAACRLAVLEQLNGQELEHLYQHNQLATNLWILTGIVNPARWPELAASRMRRVLSLAMELVDCVIVDIGFNLESDEELSSDLLAPRRNAAALTTLERAECVIAVSGSTAVGLARFLRGLNRLGELVDQEQILTVVNRVPKENRKHQELIRVFERMSGNPPDITVPEDTSLYTLAEESARLVAQLKPKGESVAQYRALAARLRIDERLPLMAK
ncbi:MAG: AAA family ATPase [Microbacteriaceae bacterium]